MDASPTADPTRAAEDWLDAFASALGRGEGADLFGEPCWWRDLLPFTFTLGTVEGRGRVARLVADRAGLARPANWRLTGPAQVSGGLIEAWFAFDCALGPAVGCVRLEGGRARHLYTALVDLAGHEEPAGPRRPLGVAHGATRERETWAQVRARETAALGLEEQPYALIVGGGQGGLALGARLRALGVPSLIVERNARAGDSWRNRYRTLVLHDPVWYDHMPYLPFPETWPVFTPKDKMGDWLEAYAQVMELPLWTSTECRSARRTAEGWAVEVVRDGEPVTLTPRHLVFATGAYGPPRRVAFPGAEAFSGTLIHSCDYRGAEEWAGRRAVVIGAASSAHDVAVDLWEAGARVTMVQRSPTTVVRSSTLMEMGFDLYSEAALARGIDVDRADHIAASVPFAELGPRQKALYDEIRARDAEFYERLAASGFALDFGPDGSGLMMKAMRTGSGYYIDVGGSDLIARGEIAVARGGVERVTAGGLRLEDGTAIAADLIVACTGYHSMHETVARIVDRATADRVGRCWGLGSGVPGDPGPWRGEPLNMWKPTAEEGLWFHGGNLALSRFHSKHLAMQLKARLEDVAPPVWEGLAPEPAEGTAEVRAA